MKCHISCLFAAGLLLAPSYAFADSLGSAVGGTAANQSSMGGGLCQGSPTALSNGQQAGFLVDCTTHALITTSGGGSSATNATIVAPLGSKISAQSVSTVIASDQAAFPVTANQGTAAAITAGWPVTNGEPADATGTFTNATQTGNVSTASVDGYGTALITINGTYGTATATFLASDDAGATFYAIACSRTDGSSVSESGYSGLTNTARAWLCPAQGFDEIRVLSSAVASGTVNVRISQTAAPTTAATVQSISGTVTSAPSNSSGAFSAVTVGTSSATAIAAAACKVVCGVFNASQTATICLNFTSAATITGTVCSAGEISLPPLWAKTWEGSYVPSDAITAIASAASTPATAEAK